MIELDNICKNFQLGTQTVHALSHINLNIKQGEYLSIMGPSGSGKSTLLNILGLLDHPSSGEYRLNNQIVTLLSDNELAHIRAKNIGFVFQFFHLIPRLTAAENIEMPLTLSGINPQQRKLTVAEALDAISLSDRADHRPEQLSGGERQRVAIARATIMKPSLLLADEPTGNLDRQTGQQIIEILEKLNVKGMTLIMITHDAEIGIRAKRRIRIVDGQITEDLKNA